jgi:hypothetical protein
LSRSLRGCNILAITPEVRWGRRPCVLSRCLAGRVAASPLGGKGPGGEGLGDFQG